MLALYIQARTWLSARLRVAENNDAGSTTVEQVIITGFLVTGAVVAGAALLALINTGIGRWSLW